MAGLNTLLGERAKKKELSTKMTAMAEQSSSGNLTSFSGLFRVVELTEEEKESLVLLLKKYQNEEHLQKTTSDEDLFILSSITSEVKAINNQAALLHGERIYKAHQLLSHYRDGAFTKWLFIAYGNRQTPYNLMQYYLLHEALPQTLRLQLQHLPRQAVYILASRDGSIQQKEELIRTYQGESKEELIQKIRISFPLDDKDQRKAKSPFIRWIKEMKSLSFHLMENKERPTDLELKSLVAETRQLLRFLTSRHKEDVF